MPLSAKSLAGPGYIILNALRVCNITCLLAVIAASIVSLVKIKMTNQFFFFEAVTHVITFAVSSFLIISELTIFRTYFARHMPLLSPAHGFVFLGLVMQGLGVNILANLNKPSMSKEELGLAFWRIVIGAGILVIIFGFFNVLASFVFRDRNLGVTARMVRAKGAVALAEQQIAQKSYTFTSSDGSTRTASLSSHAGKKPIPLTTPRLKTPDESKGSPLRFPKFGRSTLPSYHINSPPRPSSSHYSPQEGPGRRPMEISAPMRINPQFAHLINRPDSAYHPSRQERI